MRGSTVRFVQQGDGTYDIDVKGQLTVTELVFCLESLKLALLQGRRSLPTVPGMLGPDLKRIPGDVARRLLPS